MMDVLDFSKIKLVAMDMDGTALNSNHVLSPRTIAAVKAVYSKGIKVIFATGRMLNAVTRHLQEADMDGLICTNALPKSSFFPSINIEVGNCSELDKSLTCTKLIPNSLAYFVLNGLSFS